MALPFTAEITTDGQEKGSKRGAQRSVQFGLKEIVAMYNEAELIDSIFTFY